MFDEFDEWDRATPEQRPPSLARRLFEMKIGTTIFVLLITGLLLVTFPWGHWGHPREAARRAQCVNNLKQIGLAIVNYESAQFVYPPGTVANPYLPVDRRLGWNYLIAPDLELLAPFTNNELARAWDDPVLKPLRSSPPVVEFCPSNSEQPRVATYIGIAGLGVNAPDLPKGHPQAGFFGNDRIVTRTDIPDGLATTMMVAESSLPAGPWFAGGRHTVRGLDPARQPYIGYGRQFGGIHGDGANVLFSDGHVRYIKGSVNPKVLEAMSTIAGGEKFPDGWDF